MTRITWSGPKGPDADYELMITGHTNPEACAALSALWYSFTAGIERLADLHPEDLKLYQPAEEIEGVAPPPLIPQSVRADVHDEMKRLHDVQRGLDDSFSRSRQLILRELTPEQKAAYEAGRGIWEMETTDSKDGGKTICVSLRFAPAVPDANVNDMPA